MPNHTEYTTETTIKQAIEGFLLDYRVEGQPCGTIGYCSDRPGGF